MDKTVIIYNTTIGPHSKVDLGSQTKYKIHFIVLCITHVVHSSSSTTYLDNINAKSFFSFEHSYIYHIYR